MQVYVVITPASVQLGAGVCEAEQLCVLLFSASAFFGGRFDERFADQIILAHNTFPLRYKVRYRRRSIERFSVIYQYGFQSGYHIVDVDGLAYMSVHSALLRDLNVFF